MVYVRSIRNLGLRRIDLNCCGIYARDLILDVLQFAPVSNWGFVVAFYHETTLEWDGVLCAVDLHDEFAVGVDRFNLYGRGRSILGEIAISHVRSPNFVNSARTVDIVSRKTLRARESRVMVSVAPSTE